MKKIVALTWIALAAAACAPTDPADVADRVAAAESELAETLRGRAAGPPQSCVSQRLLRGNRSVGEGAIVFTGTNGMIYVNRPPAGCPELDSGRALVTRTPSSQLCRGDIATVIDPVAGFTYGSCGLGDFVPYRRLR